MNIGHILIAIGLGAGIVVSPAPTLAFMVLLAAIKVAKDRAKRNDPF